MTIDLTQILIVLMTSVFGIVTPVVTGIVNARMKDKQKAATLDNAINNSLGAMQQDIATAIDTLKPQITVARITPQMATGLQYVLDHAGDEAKYFGISQDAIVDKINAKIGLAKIADPAVPTNLPAVAVAAK